MPKWDFKCQICGEVAEYTYPTFDAAELHPPRHCRKFMVRQPAAPNFAVEGFNAKNGYADTSSC